MSDVSRAKAPLGTELPLRVEATGSRHANHRLYAYSLPLPDDLDDACELVAEIDVCFARHGAFGGGNRWGLLGSVIALQIEKRAFRTAHASAS